MSIASAFTIITGSHGIFFPILGSQENCRWKKIAEFEGQFAANLISEVYYNRWLALDGKIKSKIQKCLPLKLK